MINIITNHGDHHAELHDLHQQYEEIKSSLEIPSPDPDDDSEGLISTSSSLSRAKRSFVDVINNLGLRVYSDLISGEYKDDNLVFSPLSLSMSLAMVFLGARGATSWQMNELLRLDEMITFNPHLFFKDVAEGMEREGNDDGGRGKAACANMLLVDQVMF